MKQKTNILCLNVSKEWEYRRYSTPDPFGQVNIHNLETREYLDKKVVDYILIKLTFYMFIVPYCTIGHFSGNFRELKNVKKVKKWFWKGLKGLKKGLRRVQKYRKTVETGHKFVQWSHRRRMPENEPNQCKITHC